MSIKKNIPNILSTTRLIMALALPFVFLNTTLLNMLIFYLIGDATDALDGFLARRWKIQSKYGKIVDPIADKLLNGVALILTALINPIMYLLFTMEVVIAGVNLLRNKENKNINVSKLGKIKTVALFFTILSSMAVPMIPSLKILSNILISVTTMLQATTAANYINEYRQERRTSQLSKDELPNLEEEIEIVDEDIETFASIDEKLIKLYRAREKLNMLECKLDRAANAIIQNNEVISEVKRPIMSSIEIEQGIPRCIRKPSSTHKK